MHKLDLKQKIWYNKNKMWKGGIEMISIAIYSE
jgi:hypothetical protein